jgi:outer membrane murein-binding lipoprotein Lpp
MSFNDPVPDAEGPAVISDVVVVEQCGLHRRCCVIVAVLLAVTLLAVLWSLLRADHADHHVTRLRATAICQAGLSRDVENAQGELQVAIGNSQVAVIGSDRPAMNTAADTIAVRVKELRAAQTRLNEADTVCPH